MTIYSDLQVIRHRQHAYAMGRTGVQVGHIGGLLERPRRGEPIPEGKFLPTRFTLEGEWKEDGWPNFQLDGYGQWLWALGEHLRLGGERELPEVFAGPVRTVLAYLERFWDEPCYDAWEEHPTRLHTSTLASIYGGLRAMAAFFPSAAKTAQEVRRVVLEECLEDGRFVKFVGNPAVDASLLWVATPFGLVGEDDPRMRATVAEIERTLLRGGGLIRYAADTYFGAGAWVLLTAWLGWYWARAGERHRARELYAWVEARRDPQGHLPEQVAVPGTNPRFLDYWTRQWGSPANPLLWSHAMQIILRAEGLIGCPLGPPYPRFSRTAARRPQGRPGVWPPKSVRDGQLPESSLSADFQTRALGVVAIHLAGVGVGP